jgi:hypothetical protein
MVGKKLWQFQIHRQSTVGSSENAKKRRDEMDSSIRYLGNTLPKGVVSNGRRRQRSLMRRLSLGATS